MSALLHFTPSTSHMGCVGSLNSWSLPLRYSCPYLSTAHSLTFLRSHLKCHFTRKSFIGLSIWNSKLHSQNSLISFSALLLPHSLYYFQICYICINICCLACLNIISSMKTGIWLYWSICRIQKRAWHKLKTQWVFGDWMNNPSSRPESRRTQKQKMWEEVEQCQWKAEEQTQPLLHCWSLSREWGLGRGKRGFKLWVEGRSDLNCS